MKAAFLKPAGQGPLLMGDTRDKELVLTEQGKL